MNKPEEKRLTAYHEAAHGVMAFLKKIRIIKISVNPEEIPGSLGYMISSNKLIDEKKLSLQNRDRIEDFIMVIMAGAEGEKIFFSSASKEGALADDRAAERLLNILTHSLKEKKLYSQLLRARTETTLRENWLMVETMAARLLNKESTIQGKKVLSILKSAIPAKERLRRESLEQELNRKELNR